MNILKSMLFVMMFLMSMPVGAREKSEAGSAVVVQPHQVIVQVKGIVCSFCAYGTEKNLSQLKFLDRSKFGNGVLMDIHTNWITLALTPGKALDLHGVYKAIKDGGYDPVTVYLRLSGLVERKGNQYILMDKDLGHAFELAGDGLNTLPEKKSVEIEAHLDASKIPSSTDQPLKVVVDKIKGH